jgi:hypothetical protein
MRTSTTLSSSPDISYSSSRRRQSALSPLRKECADCRACCPSALVGFGARLSPAAAATTVRKGLISIGSQLRFGCAAAGDSRAPVLGNTPGSRRCLRSEKNEPTAVGGYALSADRARCEVTKLAQALAVLFLHVSRFNVPRPGGGLGRGGRSPLAAYPW